VRIGGLFTGPRRLDERRVSRKILRSEHVCGDQRVGLPVSALSTALSNIAA
jgi:hypothetical protein